MTRVRRDLTAEGSGEPYRAVPCRGQLPHGSTVGLFRVTEEAAAAGTVSIPLRPGEEPRTCPRPVSGAPRSPAASPGHPAGRAESSLHRDREYRWGTALPPPHSSRDTPGERPGPGGGRRASGGR